MTEDELRVLVREAIARHQADDRAGASTQSPCASFQRRVSHGLFVALPDVVADGRCFIEPAVPCNHCGFCKSFGH